MKKFERKLIEDIDKVIFDIHTNEKFIHVDYEKTIDYNFYCDEKLLSLREEKLKRILKKN